MQKSGLVEKRVVARGSKSERLAVVLITPDGEYILRRPQGNPFVDPVLETYVGRHVSCEGTLLAGSTFQADTIFPIEKNNESHQQ